MLDAGNWHGNDSAWRMTADLAKILLFADARGNLQETPQRKIFCVVDGIVGGERMGPLEPDARPAGCLIAGEHPVAVDLVATRLMGFEPRKLKQFSVAFEPNWNFGLREFGDVEIQCADRVLPGSDFFSQDNRDKYFAFAPHPGWKGQIEV
jgi:hypothetical protein